MSNILTANALNVDGAVTFWKTGCDAQVEQIRRSLSAMGRNIYQFAPAYRTPLACLRSAIEKFVLSSQWPLTGNCVVRPLHSRYGYQVFREERGYTANTLTPLFSVTFPKKGDDAFQFLPSSDLAEQESILQSLREQYEEELTVCSSEQITASLVKILINQLDALDIRLGLGGCYWLPSKHLDLWLKIVDIFCTASVGMRVGIISHRFDANSLAVVRDALVADIKRQTERIAKRATDSLVEGGKAADSLREESSAVLERVKSYEGILGESLDALREMAQQAATVEAASILAYGNSGD
jgi:hypothetical protein